MLLAFGYDCSITAPDDKALRAAAQAGQTAIRPNNGTSYTIGPSCSTLYATTGSAPDYFYGVSGAKYSYTIELRDTGRYGFTLPASQIRDTVGETWNGVLSMLAVACCRTPTG